MTPEPVLAKAVAHHFCISVSDRQEAVVWWGRIFGFQLESSFEIPHINARGAFIRNGNMRIEIFEIEGSAPTPPERLRPNTDLRTQGVKHFCFAVDDVQAALEKVYAAGVKIVGVARGKGTAMMEEEDPRMTPERPPASAFFINDPWGSLIEVLVGADFPA
jgi:methylmalonyl-CoA/ethylmalonyl-CoA epimerase